MNRYMSKSVLMFMISCLSMVFLLTMDSSIIIHIDISPNIINQLCITAMIDKQSLLFVSTVSLVTSIIIPYSLLYMWGETSHSKVKFLSIMMIFVMSMLILSLSSNLFWMMIGWDGLGISSLCLIIFYQNWKSFSSGMVTFMSNRVGDTMIIICISWSCLNYSIDSWMFHISLMSIILSLGAFSKSAQLPYSYWLPQAMAAPTPVSALVHSSTLVTAGIFTLCRFHSMIHPSMAMFMFMISCITITIAGTSSLMEFDLKKIIALSTLCHISMMMMFVLVGDLNASLFHLTMHALFKSMLFMIGGYIIHTNLNSQDIRSISEPINNFPLSLPLITSTFSMMGFPFLSGYYSKELMLLSSSFSYPSLIMFIMFMVNSMFSCAYSIRLMVNIFSEPNKKVVMVNNNKFLIIFSISTLISTVAGGAYSFFMLSGLEELVQHSSFMLVLLIISSLGILMGATIDKLCHYKLIISILKDMWKFNNVYKVIQTHFFITSMHFMWVMDEKGTAMITRLSIKTNMELISNFMSSFFFYHPMILVKTFHIIILSLLFIIV